MLCLLASTSFQAQQTLTFHLHLIIRRRPWTNMKECGRLSRIIPPSVSEMNISETVPFLSFQCQVICLSLLKTEMWHDTTQSQPIGTQLMCKLQLCRVSFWMNEISWRAAEIQTKCLNKISCCSSQLVRTKTLI